MIVFCLFLKVFVFQGDSAGGGEQHAPWLSDAWYGCRRGGRAGNGCQEASEDFEGKNLTNNVPQNIFFMILSHFVFLSLVFKVLPHLSLT